MNSNNITSYKPFAQPNYVDEDNNNKIHSLSPIDEEIIKTTALLQLKVKLSNVSPAAKSSLVYAQQVTDIINDDHLLGFLYVENYDVDVSTSVDIGLDGKFTLQCHKSHIFFIRSAPQIITHSVH